jgi:hypothetical protein
MGRKAGFMSRKRGRLWGFLILLLGFLLYRHFSPLLAGSHPSPHGPRGPFPVDRVRSGPMPAQEARDSHLDGVLVWLEGPLVKVRETRGRTLLFWVDGFKVVAYPYLAGDLDRDLLKRGRRLRVVGILRDHPRYGWEVILRRPSDLKPVPPFS